MSSEKTTKDFSPQRTVNRAPQQPSYQMEYGNIGNALFQTNGYGSQIWGSMSAGQNGMNNSSPAQLQKEGDDENVQLKENTSPSKENKTGMPDQLKSGIESLSGISMDDVRVQYNSDKPKQLNALAYAQGEEIHVQSGQDKHLPHEAWHVVQQKQGRVNPTRQENQININDDTGLEKEADEMGGKALQFKSSFTDVPVDVSTGSSTAQLLITKDPKTLIFIITALEKEYKGKVSPLFIFKEALKIWRVNDQGRTLQQEIEFTIENFDQNDTLIELKKDLPNVIDTEDVDQLEGCVKAISSEVNSIQNNVPHYPHKLGATTNVYGETEKGIPSSDLTEKLANDLRDNLQEEEVWKFKKDKSQKEKNKFTAKGYMVGVAVCSEGTFAAYSGKNEPRNEARTKTFSSIARQKNLQVFNSIFNPDLTSFTSKVKTVHKAKVIESSDTQDENYSVVKQSGRNVETGKAELGTCAGAKLSKNFPIFMTEVYVAPKNSDNVSIRDNTGQHQHYNNQSRQVPSCLNCQFLIPYIQDENGDLSYIEAKEVDEALSKAKKQIAFQESYEKALQVVDEDSIVAEVMSKIQKGVLNQHRNEIDQQIRRLLKEKITEFNNAFFNNPESVLNVKLENLSKQLFKNQQYWEVYTKGLSEKRKQEKERQKKARIEEENRNIEKKRLEKEKAEAETETSESMLLTPQKKAVDENEVVKSSVFNSFSEMIVLIVVLVLLGTFFGMTLLSGKENKDQL